MLKLSPPSSSVIVLVVRVCPVSFVSIIGQQIPTGDRTEKECWAQPEDQKASYLHDVSSREGRYYIRRHLPVKGLYSKQP